MTKTMINNKTKSCSENICAFPGQHKGEKIVLIVRKHKIVLFLLFLFAIVMAFLPMIFYIVIVPAAFPVFLEHPYSNIFLLLCAIYYGFVLIAIFVGWIDYYLDLWILTDERIIDIEQIGFFNRVVSELNFKQIQDVTSEVYGILPTMFGFGNIHLQSAGNEKRFVMETIPHPVRTRRLINKLHREAIEKVLHPLHPLHPHYPHRQYIKFVPKESSE